MKKKFIALCLTAVTAMNFIFIFARAAECLLAEEPTQVAIALIIKEEISTLEQILDNQDKMLKRWDTSSDEYKNMIKKRKEILKAIEDLRNTLKNAGALTHLSSNIESSLNSRHPAWKDGLTYDDIKTRQKNRETKWRETLRAYMKSINASQSLNASYKDLRVKLFELVKKPNGQVQAIQALGGYLDHAATMLAMNEQALQSFVTAYAEFERDEMDERQDFGKLTLEVCSKLKQHNPTTKKCKLGF